MMNNLTKRCCARPFCSGSFEAVFGGSTVRDVPTAFSITRRVSLLPTSSGSLSRYDRSFSTSAALKSRVGAAQVTVPKEVDLNIIDLPQQSGGTHTRGKEVPTSAVEVKGPLGQLTLDIPSFATLKYDTDQRKISLSVRDPEDKSQRSMWGTTRQLLNNCVLGVSEGHICILQLVGVGFRASIEPTATTVAPQYPGQQFVSLKVGYAHPIELGIPEGVKASSPVPTTILLEGIDKKIVTEFAADIRAWRKPEPYKGKGIFVNGETIRLKAKKVK